MQDLLPFAFVGQALRMECVPRDSGNGMLGFWMSDEIQGETDAYILHPMKVAVGKMGLEDLIVAGCLLLSWTSASIEDYPFLLKRCDSKTRTNHLPMAGFFSFGGWKWL